MKSLLLSLLSVCAFIATASATVTLDIGTTASGFLTNLTVSGNNTARLLWGVIIDSGGDGFAGLSGNGVYIGNATSTSGPDTLTGTSQQLSILSLDGLSTVLTNDYLFLAGQVLATGGTTDGSTGLSKPTRVANINLVGTIGQNDPFAVVWFNLNNIQLGNTTITTSANPLVPKLNAGLAYGALTIGNFTLPADGGLVDYGSNFIGADPLRTAAFTLKTVIPEPSSALLLIGAGSLLVARRRRES